MNSFFRYIVVVISLFATTGCPMRLDQSELPANVKVGDVYYSQVSLQYEKGRYLTTNYRRGILLPINSQVILQDITSEKIELEVLPTHVKFRIENVEKHTGDSTIQAFAKLFSKNKVDLSVFSEFDKKQIIAGQAANGMSKKAVIAAIGYPPITETPSLESNQWTYWSSRFNRFIIYFENGYVNRIKD